MIVNSPNRSTSAWVAREGPSHPWARTGDQHHRHHPGSGEPGPHDKSRPGWEEGADADHRHGHTNAGDITTSVNEEFWVAFTILTPDAVPQPRQHGEERCVREGERTAAAIGCIGREHRQQNENPHLDEDDVAGSSVLTAVEIEVDGSVHPSNPDQRKDDGELADATSRHVLGEMMRCLGDDSDIHQVIEEFQKADRPAGDDLAVGSRRAPQPALEAATGRLIGHRLNVATHPSPSIHPR